MATSVECASEGFVLSAHHLGHSADVAIQRHGLSVVVEAVADKRAEVFPIAVIIDSGRNLGAALGGNLRIVICYAVEVAVFDSDRASPSLSQAIRKHLEFVTTILLEADARRGKEAGVEVDNSQALSPAHQSATSISGGIAVVDAAREGAVVHGDSTAIIHLAH